MCVPVVEFIGGRETGNIPLTFSADSGTLALSMKSLDMRMCHDVTVPIQLPVPKTLEIGGLQRGRC